MNNIQKINYGPLGTDLRIIIDDEQKIWFVAKDIGEMLELKNIKQNIADFPKGVCNTYSLATSGGVQHGCWDSRTSTRTFLNYQRV